KAGADPNDGQALYNRMFQRGHLCLELMLEFGLGPEGRCNWLIEDGNGGYKPHPDQTLHYQLKWAIKSGYVDRAKLLVEHEAGLETASGEPTLYELALLAGEKELADFLVDQGAERPELDPETVFAVACVSGREEEARALLKADPGLLERCLQARPELLKLAVENGRYDSVRLLADLGVEVKGSEGPIYNAVWEGDLEMVRLLIDLGVNPQHRDGCHDATPMQWASFHKDRKEIMDFLVTCEIDIFDAVLADDGVKIDSLLEKNPESLEMTRADLRYPPKKGADQREATPLMFAVLRNKPEAAKALLTHGASRDVTDSDGRTLLQLTGDEALVRILSTD
ncbi:MAG: ankyrin repeat domain-containing protein, partial [Verrucomicrobiota bacterium]